MKKNKKNKKTLLKRLISFTVFTALCIVASLTCFGANFGSSVIATGTENLLNDVLTWLYIIVPIVGALFFVYFAIRRVQADEQDKKRWENKMAGAVIFTILGLLGTSIISLFTGYYT